MIQLPPTTYLHVVPVELEVGRVLRQLAPDERPARLPLLLTHSNTDNNQAISSCCNTTPSRLADFLA